MAVQENMTYQQVQTNLLNSAGKVFTRKGWPYNLRCIYQVPSGVYPTVTVTAQTLFGTEVTIAAYIAWVDKSISGEEDVVRVGWKPTAADTAARDWVMMDVADFGTLPPPPPLPQP